MERWIGRLLCVIALELAALLLTGSCRKRDQAPQQLAAAPPPAPAFEPCGPFQSVGPLPCFDPVLNRDGVPDRDAEQRQVWRLARDSSDPHSIQRVEPNTVDLELKAADDDLWQSYYSLLNTWLGMHYRDILKEQEATLPIAAQTASGWFAELRAPRYVFNGLPYTCWDGKKTVFMPVKLGMVAFLPQWAKIEWIDHGQKPLIYFNGQYVLLDALDFDWGRPLPIALVAIYGVGKDVARRRVWLGRVIPSHEIEFAIGDDEAPDWTQPAEAVTAAQ